MKTAIMTDTNSGFRRKKQKELGIFLLPMPVIIDEATRYEGKNLSSEELL